ncbi:hypothetical protein WJX81_005184 [Elliptochloris bilobata]|uniref:CRAL-TRIO domain-containing protein n=1 Tax=Elliptochloris bilobata TaxID=381761 RepID=A0AAW1QW39_9CHLO
MASTSANGFASLSDGAPGANKQRQEDMPAVACGSSNGSVLCNGQSNGRAYAAHTPQLAAPAVAAPPQHAFTLLDPNEEAELAANFPDLVADPSPAGLGLEEPPSLAGAARRRSTSDEEERIAQELAEVEAEANAHALAQQRSLGGEHSGSGYGGDLDERRYSVSLDEPAQRAMAEAEAAMAEAVAGSHAAQGALDDFAKRARPFSPPPGSLRGARFVPDEAETEAFEPPEFQGMLYYDGVDSLGRPVVVVNADAVAAKVSRRAAGQYMLRQLEPLVAQGPYVLVLLNTGHAHRSNRLPAGWLLTTYRSLSRPFRKHVKRIVLVRPSAGLKALLALLRPFASRKAGRKIVAVESLTGIEAATRGEVAIAHLGPRFAAAAGRLVSEGSLTRAISLQRGASGPGGSPF